LKEHPLKFRGQSMAIQNGLLVAFVGTFMATAYYQWPLMAALCGFFLFMNVNCAHNFFHLRDTWRMHVWDLSLLSSYEWRITHALSHHIFTNTVINLIQSNQLESRKEYSNESNRMPLMIWTIWKQFNSSLTRASKFQFLCSATDVFSIQTVNKNEHGNLNR